MEAGQQSDVLGEAVEVAQARLEVGDELIPLLITDRWGDRRIDRFEPNGLSEARGRFEDFLKTAAGDESCALVYLGRVGDGDDAILIERGGAGYGPPELFIQRFRPRRGRFRGFKLIGKPKPAGASARRLNPWASTARPPPKHPRRIPR
jgi:hypothetical protein